MKNMRCISMLALALCAGTAAAQEFVDNCGDATPVGDGTFTFDLSLATNDAAGTCGLSSTAPDMWVKYVATADGTATFATCGLATFDTVIAIFDSCGGSQLVCLDDFCGLQTQVSYSVTVGTAYYIRISGYNSAVGGGQMQVGFPPPPPPPPPGEWNETVSGGGDAGDVPASAQQVTGSGDLIAISGTLGQAEADMYAITICNPDAFSASLCGTTFDTQMFLFNDSGLGVAVNDDSCGLQSALSSLWTAGQASGTYYLTVSQYNRDPIDDLGQLIWLNTPFASERAPDGPGAASPIAGWAAGGAAGGNYSIALTGACFVGGGGCVVTCDFNQDGGGDNSDVFDLADSIASGTDPFPASCKDFNQDGGADNADIFDMANAIAGSTCP